MEITKQYIAQCLHTASANLRFSAEKLEVLGLLQEAILFEGDLEMKLLMMKKVTEFSRLAIKLSEIHKFLTTGKLDFNQISDRFKEHSSGLVKELSQFMDSASLSEIKIAVQKLDQLMPKPDQPEYSVSGMKEFQDESERFKEKFIFEDEVASDDIMFQNYEHSIMRPIKSLDLLLRRLPTGDIHHDEFIQFAKVMKQNAQLSEKYGMDIISNMHLIIGKTLLLIKNRDMMPGKELINALRACLIVIVALVKNKEVDITAYLHRAEEFGEKVKAFKVKE